MEEQESSMFYTICAVLVLLMMLGLQMIEAGSVRAKNVSSVFMRGFASLTISIICSWICGYMFTFSEGHYLLGYDHDYLILHKVPQKSYPQWIVFACVSSLPSSIVASSMSERTHLTGHLILSMFLSLIIFPTSAHWIWHSQGWLHALGCSDLGGVLVVHIFSGFGALVGSILVGPRVERIGDNYRDVSLPGHSLPLTAIGAMFVIIGMIGKMAGLGVPGDISHVAVNSLVGGAGGGLVTMNLFKLKARRGKKNNKGGHENGQSSLGVINRKWSYLCAFNGFFTGMICVCGVGTDLPSWGAFIAGIVGGFIFFLTSGLLRLNKVDDPVFGIGVHLSGGFVGAIVVGLCNLAKTHTGMKIGWEVVGLVAISAWACGCFILLLLPLLLCGKLRIKDCQEKLGMDAAKIKEPAYNISTPNLKQSRHHQALAIGDGFLTPFTQTRAGNLSCHLSAINKKSHQNCSRCSGLDLDGVNPKIVVGHPSPGGSILSNIPNPPPYPTSTMKKDSSLTVPELTLASSCVSVNDDSEAPLLNNSLSRSKGAICFDKELKKNIRKQKQKLRKTDSIYRTNRSNNSNEEVVNSSVDGSPNSSSNSVKSIVVRQVAVIANNTDNFNYLNNNVEKEGNDGLEMKEGVSVDEVNDTSIDISKYLKSPVANPQDDDDKKVYPTSAQEEKKEKLFESSITFVSDDDDDEFSEKLI